MTIADLILEKAPLIEKTNTFARVQCPVCKGSSLKINLSEGHSSYGAYRCWGNYCSPAKIRSELGILGEQKQFDSFSRPSPFARSNAFRQKTLISETSTIENSFAGTSFVKLTGYPVNRLSVSLRVGGKSLKKTTFLYTPYCRVTRLDRGEGDKQVFLQHWVDAETGWLAGTGDYLWPVYGSTNQFRTYCQNLNTADAAIFVEGEKAAEWLRAYGYAAFTLPVFAFQGDPAKAALEIFKIFFPQVKNILYIPDEDAPGLSKEKCIRLNCDQAGLRYRDFRLNTLFKDCAGTGFDVADLAGDQVQMFFEKVESLVGEDRL